MPGKTSGIAEIALVLPHWQRHSVKVVDQNLGHRAETGSPNGNSFPQAVPGSLKTMSPNDKRAPSHIEGTESSQVLRTPKDKACQVIAMFAALQSATLRQLSRGVLQELVTRVLQSKLTFYTHEGMAIDELQDPKEVDTGSQYATTISIIQVGSYNCTISSPKAQNPGTAQFQ